MEKRGFLVPQAETPGLEKIGSMENLARQVHPPS